MNENLEKILNILKNTKVFVDMGRLEMRINLNRIKSVYSIIDPKHKEYRITEVRYNDNVVTEVSGYNEIHRSLLDSYGKVYAEEWFDYDENGNEIYFMSTDDNSEEWYDSNGNCIHYKESDSGYEEWKEYDDDKLVYFKNSLGEETKYD